MVGSSQHYHHLQLLHRRHTNGGSSSAGAAASHQQHSSSKIALLGALLLLASCTLFVSTRHTQQLRATSSIAAARSGGQGHGGAGGAAGSVAAAARQGAASGAQQQVVARGRQAGSSGGAAIPRIIHQNYLAGKGQLLADALRPRAHFRKEWWAACQTHHPGWQYVLWDGPACEALLASRAPWFLPMWRALGNNTVLKSDAIRPFILEAHGGVYLDLDSECFTDMQPWLDGAQVVLQAEVPERVNNAQMASVPGHPLWAAFQRAIHRQLRGGNRWALDATGPHLLTAVLRKLVGNARASLPGRYTLRDGSRLVVYGPRQFFTPCAWNDWGCAVDLARNTPHMRAAGKTAAIAAAARASALAANSTSIGIKGAASSSAAAPGGGQQQGAASLPLMLDVQGVAGVHHFSGSWLGLDGSKSLSLRREAVTGVLRFLYNGTGFLEHHCSQLRHLPQVLPAAAAFVAAAAASQPPADVLLAAAAQAAAGGSAPAPALPAVPVCWEQVAAAIADGSCRVVSVRASLAAPHAGGGGCPGGVNGTLAPLDSSSSTAPLLGAELALAAAGCQVSLVAPQAPNLTALAAALGGTAADTNAAASPRRLRFLWRFRRTPQAATPVSRLLSRLRVVEGALGVVPDPFAPPPVYMLDALLAAAASSAGSSRVTLLMLQPEVPPSCAGRPGSTAGSSSGLALDVLNALYVGSSPALTGLGSAVLLLPHPLPGAAHKAVAAYAHLWQERGFLGYAHAPVASPSSSDGAVLIGVTRVAAASG